MDTGNGSDRIDAAGTVAVAMDATPSAVQQRPIPIRRSRILFVDDEPHVLSGLARALHARRDVWDMKFAPDAAAALAELSASQFDVVVSDLRMSKVSGAELLAEVQKRQPEAIRIILSGFADSALTLRTVGVAHQFIAKPATPEKIVEVLERACRSHASLHGSAIKQSIGGIASLPVLPRIYRDLSTAANNPDSTVDDIVKVINSDAAICAKVLHLVNSSFFGLARTLSSPREAILHLGLSRLKDLVLSECVFSEFRGSSVAFLADEQRHAALVGILAAKIMPDRKLADDAFTIAVLHDIGGLIIATRFEEEAKRIQSRLVEHPDHVLEIERIVLGVTHAQAGAYLLGLWGLPYGIVDAVANHHDLPAIDAVELDTLTAIQFAERLLDDATRAAGGAPRFALPMAEITLRVKALGLVDRWKDWEASASRLVKRSS